MTTNGRDYSVVEAAELLRVSPQTLRMKVAEGVWPHTRLTRKITFTDAQIQQIRQLGAVDPRPARAPRNRKAS